MFPFNFTENLEDEGDRVGNEEELEIPDDVTGQYICRVLTMHLSQI